MIVSGHRRLWIPSIPEASSVRCLFFTILQNGFVIIAIPSKTVCGFFQHELFPQHYTTSFPMIKNLTNLKNSDDN